MAGTGGQVRPWQRLRCSSKLDLARTVPSPHFWYDCLHPQQRSIRAKLGIVSKLLQNRDRPQLRRQGHLFTGHNGQVVQGQLELEAFPS